MKIIRPKNTKERGLIEFFVYEEKKTFIGVCLTFDIIEEGTNAGEVIKNLKEAALLHLEVVRTKNLSDGLLNRYAPEKYWKKYFGFLDYLEAQRVASNAIKSLPSAIQSTYNKSGLTLGSAVCNA